MLPAQAACLMLKILFVGQRGWALGGMTLSSL